MSLDIGNALDRGIRRTVARDGLSLVAITYVMTVVSGALGPGRVQRVLSQDIPLRISTRALVEIPAVLDAFLSLLFSVATVFVSLAALRVFVGEERETLPPEVFTRNALWAFLNFVVGAIVFGIVVGIGFVLFVLPGLFLLVSLIFWDVFVAVEDDNFVDGFHRSWGVTAGHRLSLFALGVAYVIIGLLVGIGVGFTTFLLGPFSVFLTAVGNAVLTVFASAVLASAYRQLASGDLAGSPADKG